MMKYKKQNLLASATNFELFNNQTARKERHNGE